MNKPKMRPITIEADAHLRRWINIEALTPEAQTWVQTHAAEFGGLGKSTTSDKGWCLSVYEGYNCAEVVSYLNDLWDSERWPTEVEDSITTDAADTSHSSSAT